ncbi:MAG: hypothetical protein NW226_12135 [Microscillaceae bacterium]|nr:hypothetical protein [Microscillaceae bacterium]
MTEILSVMLGIGLVLIAISNLLLLRLNLNCLKKSGNLQEEKSVVYTRFIEAWFTATYANSTENTSFIIDRLSLLDLKKHLILWASQEVLREYNKLTKMTLQDKPHIPDIIKQSEKVILAMREDLGEKNDTIEAEGLF